MLLSDLHIHSTFSDGKFTIPQIVDIYGSEGFDVIAITDHLVETNTVLGKIALKLDYSLTRENFSHYLEIIHEQQERAWDQYKMVVIPGYELTKNYVRAHKSAHLVALGMEEYIDASAKTIDLVRRTKALGGVAIAAHPYFTDRLEPQTLNLWLNRRELEAEMDAWEVGNGCYYFNELAESGYPVVANSDFHDLHQLTSWKTVIHAKKNIPDILQAIRTQDLEVTFYQSNLLGPQDTVFSDSRAACV